MFSRNRKVPTNNIVLFSADFYELCHKWCSSIPVHIFRRSQRLSSNFITVRVLCTKKFGNFHSCFPSGNYSYTGTITARNDYNNVMKNSGHV